MRRQRSVTESACSGLKGRRRTLRRNYPTVYYPGTIDSRQAVALRVGLVELPGIGSWFGCTACACAAVSHPPSGSGSPPLFLMVTLAPVGQHDASGQPHSSLIRNSKGEFEFTDVLPGEYRPQVMEALTNRMSAERMVDVGDQDIEGLQLTPGSLQTLNGQVIVPEGRKLPVGLIVMLGSREAGDTRGGGMAQVGRWCMQDFGCRIGDSDVLLASTSGTDDAYIDTIRTGDRDAPVEGVHVGEGQLPPLQIVLSRIKGRPRCFRQRRHCVRACRFGAR
jgi:hypothetical protein